MFFYSNKAKLQLNIFNQQVKNNNINTNTSWAYNLIYMTWNRWEKKIKTVNSLFIILAIWFEHVHLCNYTISINSILFYSFVIEIVYKIT